MKASVDKLRWGLAGGALLLLLTLVGFVGYGRYKALKNFMRHPIPGGTLEQTTDSFTYSQSIQGRTVFTLHAAKAIQHGNGKYTLRDVILTLYGHGSARTDRISGAQFEYDEKAGIARAVGDVEMDVGAPGALVKPGKPAQDNAAGNNAKDDAQHDIHVHTSGLVYVRKLGVAATDQLVDIHYAGIECTAKGAEFDSNESVVHLLADVQLHGDVRGKPLQLHASKADLNRNTNVITMADPIVTSGVQRLQAVNATVHLRTDGSVEAAQADGNVVMQQGTRRMGASHVDATFNAQSLPQLAKFTGGVTMDDSDPKRPMHGTAGAVDATFDAVGAPVHAVATGNAQLSASASGSGGVNLPRSLKGDRIEGMFTRARNAKKSQISEVHATGNASARGESQAQGGGVKTTQLAADDLRASFAGGSGRTPDLHAVVGEGHTHLQQDAPRGEQQISSGDHVELVFAPATSGGVVQLASAVQNGHVQVKSQSAKKPNAAVPDPVFASADRSTYDGLNEKLTLAGEAKFTQGDTGVSASSIVVDQKTGDADASGTVLATFENQPKTGAPKPGAQGAAHVRSDSAHLQHALQLATFKGSDARPVRLWQEASQVEAATVMLDGKRHTLTARPEAPAGLVHAVFAGVGSAKVGAKPVNAEGLNKPGNPEHRSQVARITANTMDYDDVGRVANFSGSVRIDDEDGLVQAQHATAFLTPAEKGSPEAKAATATVAPFGGSLQRVVIWGEVHLAQPGRTGRGDRLVYTAADSSFVLTGTPGHMPQIVDQTRGSVTGNALLFKSGDNTIIVSGGTPGTPQNERGHLRTESGAKH
ncbi:MAG TPA: LptA/OstA family protein [Acidobacteriaceae bacterium]|jgi:lipopolysaccharide export system protein LptA